MSFVRRREPRSRKGGRKRLNLKKMSLGREKVKGKAKSGGGG
jgi:hypothetical protein